jgi:hypothetical protein
VFEVSTVNEVSENYHEDEGDDDEKDRGKKIVMREAVGHVLLRRS